MSEQRFGPLIPDWILGLFFMLVILFIQYLITITSHPIIIDEEIAEKYRNTAV